jgi:hypothetical protein
MITLGAALFTTLKFYNCNKCYGSGLWRNFVVGGPERGCHDNQHNDIQNNNTQHNETQPNGVIYDTKHK